MGNQSALHLKHAMVCDCACTVYIFIANWYPNRHKRNAFEGGFAYEVCTYYLVVLESKEILRVEIKENVL